MNETTDPQELNAIAGKILALIADSVSCSDEVLVAALKVAAATIDEAKSAQLSATLRAMMREWRPKI
jgi:hypothetical protein